MTVLVTAASKHGATLEIAEAIARVLDGHDVSFVRDPGKFSIGDARIRVYVGDSLDAPFRGGCLPEEEVH